MNKQLSKNFSLDELIQSDLVDKVNSDKNPNNDIDNTPDETEEKNLDLLADNILQPLRDYLGYEVEINSGFRGAELNRAIKGASSSQHCKGQAADIRCREMRKAFLYIQNNLLNSSKYTLEICKLYFSTELVQLYYLYYELNFQN